MATISPAIGVDFGVAQASVWHCVPSIIEKRLCFRQLGYYHSFPLYIWYPPIFFTRLYASVPDAITRDKVTPRENKVSNRKILLTNPKNKFVTKT